MTVVRAPKTMKRMPTRSTWNGMSGGGDGSRRSASDGDADFDADGGGVGRPDAETEAGTVGDAGRHREEDTVVHGDSPVPAHASHGSGHVSPRPPQTAHVPRSGTSSGMTVPRAASRLDSQTSVWNVHAPFGPPRNASRSRSTSGAKDGKSMVISSAKQS